MIEIAENDVLTPLAKDGAQVDLTIRVAAEPEFTAATVGHCSMPDGIATGSAVPMVSVGYYPLTVLTQDAFALVKSHLHPDDSEGGYCD